MAWLLGAAQVGTLSPPRLTSRVEVFLIPPQPRVDASPAPEPSPAPPPPASADEAVDGDSDGPTRQPPPPTESSAPEPPSSTMPRAPVDWGTEIARAVERMRAETPRYRSFGRPEAARDAEGRRADRARTRTPGEIETTSWGEQRAMINDSCYESRYEPGSALGEAHRFMNPFVVCMPSAPAEPRDDLFEDSKPAYLR